MFRLLQRTCFLLCLFALGCSGSDQRGAVKGTVSLDGKPLADGRIEFLPAAGNKGPSTGTSITAGTYSLPTIQGATLGPNRVEIRANVRTGNKVPDPATGGTLDEILEGVPPKYNTESTLIVEVKSGQNVFTFALESK